MTSPLQALVRACVGFIPLLGRSLTLSRFAWRLWLNTAADGGPAILLLQANQKTKRPAVRLKCAEVNNFTLKGLKEPDDGFFYYSSGSLCGRVARVLKYSANALSAV